MNIIERRLKMFKKKIMILWVIIISLFSLVGCNSSYNKLNNSEQEVFDAFVINLESFYNYEDVRIISATAIEDNYIFIKVSGTNTFGVSMNRWYFLAIENGYIGSSHVEKGDIFYVDDLDLYYKINYEFNYEMFNKALEEYWND